MPPNRVPALAVFVLLSLVLGSLVAFAHEPPRRTAESASPERGLVAAGRSPVITPRSQASRQRPLRPVATKGGEWSGYAFDACRAPSQRVMDRWLHRSPFTGVGIYLGGIHRACPQRHLTARWVSRQTRNGWQLLPIWVGPQAACTGYDHRIPVRSRNGFAAARKAGVHQARMTMRTARDLGIGPGQVIFYDIEPYDTWRAACRRSALVFLEGWTRELHRGGYRSGVYSHVKAAISSLDRAPRGFTRPDAVWYAWIDRAGSMPRKYVDPAFMRHSRVHQFVLDTRVRFGGIAMAIDWNLVRLGGSTAKGAPAPCGRAADRLRPGQRISKGARGRHVEVVSCLLAWAGSHEGAARRVYDDRTAATVRAFQRARGLPETGAVGRDTLTALFAEGPRPLLKHGSTGEPVRRLQRSLNAALSRPVAVDGIFGRGTERAVRRYQQLLGRAGTGVVAPRTWGALTKGVTAGTAVAAQGGRPGKAGKHGGAARPGEPKATKKPAGKAGDQPKPGKNGTRKGTKKRR